MRNLHGVDPARGGGRIADDAAESKSSHPESDGNDSAMAHVLESAARLQELVPDAVLVGGSAAAFYARHRLSYHHDHVLGDLADRFEMILDAIESEGDWVTNRITYGKVILGELGGIEAGVRQMIRKRPLEVATVTLPSGSELRVPTMAETLRIKAFLLVRRNQVRDYLDVVALAETMGFLEAARVLSDIDNFYGDQRGDGDGISTQVARQLADPRPKDVKVTSDLSRYKGLVVRWQSWAAVVDACRHVATLMLERPARSEGTSR